jgi:hypothetical protein
MADGENRYRRTWDYDRFRGTIGLRLTYWRAKVCF